MTNINPAVSIRTFSSNKPLVKQRRQEIANGAVEVFIKKGYDRASMRDIATACGITTGALYYYVGSKRDILLLVLALSQFRQNKNFELMQSQSADLNALEAIQQAIKIFLGHVNEQQDLYIFLEHLPLVLNREDRRILFEAATANHTFFSNILKQGVDAGEFRNVNPDFIASIIIQTASAWALSRWALRKQYTLEEYTGNLTEFIMDSVRKC